MTRDEALPILILLSRLDGWIATKDVPVWLKEQLKDEVNKLLCAIKNENTISDLEGESIKSVDYLAKFRAENGAMATNAIDYYQIGDEIIKHEWGIGGETKRRVYSVPNEIEGYVRMDL